VSWYPVTVLPVVDTNDHTATLTFPCIGFHEGYWWKFHAPGICSVLLPDSGPQPTPWAADLVPGCVVVVPGDEVRPDEPITEMVIPIDGMPDLDELVPLALEDGLNVVELARP
jgi:hypothetical protein